MDNPDLELYAEFFLKSVENPQLSRDEGRPIFEDKEYIRIKFPADNKRELVAPAGEMHYVSHAKQQMTYAERFGPIYEAFRNNDLSFVSGTPLSSTSIVTQAKCEELKAFNVVTVEQLAALPDASMRRLGMGARAMVDDAKAYLDRTKGLGELEALRAKVAQLEGQAPAQSLSVAPLDAYADFEDEDLKNMIKDAGGEVPRGRATRQTLVEALDALSKEKEEA